MASTSTTTRKPAAKRAPKRPATRATVAKRPSRHSSRAERLAAWLARHVARHAKAHREVKRTRRDAAILRLTHQGCDECKGLGVITKRAKDGSYAGSKTCTAKPREVKVTRMQVRAAARGIDKRSGLLGWKCPCGNAQKPRYHDDKAATRALRDHEKRKHGGRQMGGGLVLQVPEGVDPAALPAAAPKTPLTKTNTGKPMTDLQWLAQNSRLTPAAAKKKGFCEECGGKGGFYNVETGVQTTTVCKACNGRGKPAKAA